jgi:hypothetical protein
VCCPLTQLRLWRDFVAPSLRNPLPQGEGVFVFVRCGVQAAALFNVGAGSAANDRIEAEVEIRQLDGAIDKYALARSATLQDRGCVVVAEDDAPAAFGGETPATEKAATGQ